MSSKKKQNLTRSVLRGLAMATLLSGSLVSTSYAAQVTPEQQAQKTQAITENRDAVQQQIDAATQAGQVLTVTDTQNQDLSALESNANAQVVNSTSTATSTGQLNVRAVGDQATNNVKVMEVNQGENAPTSGSIRIYHDANDTGTTDFSNTKLVLNHGNITIVNGTVKTNANNIVAHLGQDDTSHMPDSTLEVGSVSGSEKATLQLTGNVFGGLRSSWYDSSTSEEHPYSVFHRGDGQVIQVNPTGTLEANSELIFANGLGENGMETNPSLSGYQSVNDHLKLADGSTVKLDDSRYNDEYLENLKFGLQNGIAGAKSYDSEAHKPIYNKVNLAPVEQTQTDTMRTIGGIVDGAGNLNPDTNHTTVNAQNTAEVNFKNDFAGNANLRTIRVVNGATANITLQNNDVYHGGIYDDDHKGVLQAGREVFSYGGENYSSPIKAPNGEGASTGTINLQFADGNGVANLTNVDLKTTAVQRKDKDGHLMYQLDENGRQKLDYHSEPIPIMQRNSINIVNGTVETMKSRLHGTGEIHVGGNDANAQKATLRFMDKRLPDDLEGDWSNIIINSSGTLEGQSSLVFNRGYYGDGSLGNLGIRTNPLSGSQASNPIVLAEFKNGASVLLDDAFYNDEYLENAKHYLANANNRYGFGWVQDADGNDTTTPISVNLAMNPNAINVSHTVNGGTEALNFSALEGMNGGNLRIVRAINNGTLNINLQNGDSFHGGRDDESSRAKIQAGRVNFTGDTTGGSQGTVNLQFANPENATANLKNISLAPTTYPTLNANVDAKTATSNDVTYHDSVMNLVNGTVQSKFDNISPLDSNTTVDSKGNFVSTFNYVDKDGNAVRSYHETDEKGNPVEKFRRVDNYDEVNADDVSLSSITPGTNAGIVNVQKAATLDFSNSYVSLAQDGDRGIKPVITHQTNGNVTTTYRPKGVVVQGTIEANSFQLFDNGVGGLGTNADTGMTADQIKDRLGGFDFQDGSTLLLNDPFVQEAEGNHAASDAYLAAVKNALGANVNVQWANANAKAPAVTDYTSAMGSQSIGALNLGTATMADSQNLTAQMLGANGTVDANTNARTLLSTISNSTFTLGTPNNNVELFTDSANSWLPNKSNARLEVQNNTALTLNTGDANKSNHFTGTIALADTQNAAEGQTQQQNTLNFNGGKVLVDTVTAGNHAQVNVNQGAQAQISNLTLNAGSQFNVAGGTYDGSLFAGQSASIQANSDSEINITNGGTVRNVSINVPQNGTDSNAPAPRINVGNDQGAGHLVLDNNPLTNAQVFLDPVWGNGTQGTYEGASTLTNSNGSVDYTLTVGQNSIAGLGTNAPTNTEQAFDSVAAVFGPTNRTAVLYADSPITVSGNGGILVDGSLTNANTTGATLGALATTGNINFAAGSALLVNGNGNFNGNAVINGTGNTTLTVDPNSHVYFTGKIDGAIGNPRAFQLANNVNSDANANNWYTHPDREHGIVAPWNFDVTSNGQDSVTLTRRNWNALNGAMQNIVNGVWDSMPASANGASSNPATEALFGAYGSMQGWRSAEEAAALTNTYSMPAETTGATYLATQATHSLTDTAQNRYSLLGEDMETDNAGIWLKYGHSNFNVDGLEMSNLDGKFDGNYNTISLGFDFARNEKFAQGIALGYAKGSSSGRFESNDFHVGGLSYYGAVRHGRSNTLFDLGYYKAKSDVDGVIDANPDTDLLSLGVKNEYRFDAGEHASYVPYIGLRWTRVNTDSYTGSYGGSAVFNYNPSTENLFTIPLGISYLKETQAKDWTYKFKINLGYVAALGGRSADMNVTALGGSNASGAASYDIADQSTWLAGLGFNASNDKMHWGLGYQYHHSSDSHGHNITANIGWSF